MSALSAGEPDECTKVAPIVTEANCDKTGMQFTETRILLRATWCQTLRSEDRQIRAWTHEDRLSLIPRSLVREYCKCHSHNAPTEHHGIPSQRLLDVQLHTLALTNRAMCLIDQTVARVCR